MRKNALHLVDNNKTVLFAHMVGFIARICNLQTNGSIEKMVHAKTTVIGI